MKNDALFEQKMTIQCIQIRQQIDESLQQQKTGNCQRKNGERKV